MVGIVAEATKMPKEGFHTEGKMRVAGAGAA